MSGITIYEIHGRVLQDTFDNQLSDSDCFLLFTLLHQYRLILAAPVLADRPNVLDISALTQRGVSESLASLWVGTEDPRADPNYWYFRWNGVWGSYGHSEHLTQTEVDRLDYLRRRLEQHRFISQLIPEE